MFPRYKKSQDPLQSKSTKETGHSSTTQQREMQDMVAHFKNLSIPSPETHSMKAVWPQRSCLPKNSSHELSGQKHTGIRETTSKLGAERRNMNGENLEEQQSKHCTSPPFFKFTFHDVNDGFQPQMLPGVMESEEHVGQRSDDSGWQTSRALEGNFLGGNDEGYESS